MSQLDRILVARGGKRPETPDEWEKYEADKKARRAKNVANAREVLERNEIEWYETKLPSGVMFVLDNRGDSTIYYYPETGKWMDSKANTSDRFGVRNLVKYIQGELK